MTTLRAHKWETPAAVEGEVVEHVLGCRYDPGLDVKDIAKEIRKMIRDAIRAGYLPAMKTSVRIQRFAGGRSIDIEVVEASVGRESDEGNEAAQFLQRCLDAYQRSEYWGQADYHDVNFWGFVSWYAEATQ